MAIKSKPLHSWPMLGLLALAFIFWLVKEIPPQADSSSPRSESFDSRYEKYDGCRLVKDRRNDGDSFKVEFPDGRVEELRLYFVDAPESQFRSYGGGRTNHQRIDDQARDLKVSPETAVELGQKAKKLTERILSEDRFTVFTRWDDPFGDRRYHAFIEAPDTEVSWLHERLAAAGLVRIHTKGADLPNGRSKAEQERYLYQLESQARSVGAGAWQN